MTLTEFLTARYDEEEAAAKACQSPSPWKAATHPSDHWIVTDATGDALIYDEGTPTLEEAAHIARHDPARVLREVEAKRKIVELHRPDPAEYIDADGDDRSSVDCWTCETGGVPDSWPCPTIRAAAAVYSDHPDYNPDWSEQ